MAAKTPSQSRQETLDNIHMIVGQIAEAEDLSNMSLEDIDDKLGKNGIEDVILGIDVMKDSLVTAANMLVAIAGYLLGEKGINEKTAFSQLTGKIQNTAPIIGNVPIGSGDGVGNPASEGIIDIIISGIDNNGLEALTNLMEVLSADFTTNKNSKELKAFKSSIEILTLIVNELNNIDFSGINKTKLNHIEILNKISGELSESFKLSPNTQGMNDFILVIPQLGNITQGLNALDFSGVTKLNANFKKLEGIVNGFANLELKKFNKTYLDGIERMSSALATLLDIPLFKQGLDPTVMSNISNSDVLFETIKIIVGKFAEIDFKQFNKTFVDKIENFEIVIDCLLNACELVQEIIKIDDEEDFLEVDNFVKNFKKNVIDKLVTLDFSAFTKEKVDEIKDFNKFLISVTASSSILAKSIVFMEIVNSFEDTFKNYTRILAELISGNNGKGGLVMVMNRITKAVDGGLDLKVVNNFFSDLYDVMKTLTKLGILTLFATIFSPFINSAINVLNNIITKVGEINIKEITVNAKSLHEFANFLTDMRNVFISVTLCGLFAGPALLGALIIRFTASIVLKSIEVAINNINEIISDDKTIPSIMEFGKVMLVLTGIMLLAALTGGLLVRYAENIFGFAIVFSGFMLMIVGTLALISLIVKPEKVEAISQLTSIIVGCAFVMMIGALFMLTGLAAQALMFGAVLSVFIAMVMLPFVIYSVFFKNAIAGAEEISRLIITCSLVLMLGALFMMIPGLWLKALLFGAILTVFVTLILLPFIMFIKLGGRKALKAVDDIKDLIITCTSIMIIGALFMYIPGFGTNALLFAALVAGFVFAIVAPFILVGNKLNKAKGALFGIMTIILASSLMIMIGAAIISQYGWENPLIFAGIVVGMITILSGVAFLLSKAGATIMKGVGAMAAIAGIAVLGAFSMSILGDAFQKFGDWKQAIAMAAIMCGVALAFGGLSLGLGALASIPFFWIGIGAMAAVAGIALIFSAAMQKIGEAAKLIAEADATGFSIEGSLAIVSGMITIGQAVAAAGLALPTTLITKTAVSFMAVAKMMSQIGIAVQDMANLKCAVGWDKDGNPTSYRQLKYEDFENAANNTSIIITTLGKAIIETYNLNPDIFEEPSAGGIAGFFGKKGKSPFDIVVRSCTGMGNMISTIGHAVSNVSNLKVATKWDSDGNPIAYERLKKEDFVKAAENTKEIITTLGGAIIETYNSNKEMFEVPPVETSFLGIKIKKEGKGKTPFEKTVIACTAMGGMISSIANGVKDMADLKIATSWDKDGNPTAYRRLTRTDFADAAANINEIITVVGSKIAEVYAADTVGIFQQGLTFKDGKLEGGDTPVLRVLTAADAMGSAMSSIAAGVKDMADLRVEVYDSNGKPTGTYRTLTTEDFKAAAENVGAVVTALATPLAEVYNNNKKLFDPVVRVVKTKDGWFSDEYKTETEDSPILKVLKVAGNLGDFVSSCALAVKEMADLNIKDADGNPVKIKLSDLKEGGKVYTNIDTVISCIGKALVSVYNKGSETYLNPDYKGFVNIQKSIEKSKELITNSIQSIVELNNSIADIPNCDELVKKWDILVTGLYKPIANGTVTNNRIQTNDNLFKYSNKNIREVVNNINRLNTDKTDKFIELASKLSELSVNLGNMEGIVDALNGRINETLLALAEKLEFAANTIEASDKAQEKRQKLIDKNTAKIEKVMKMPMTVNVTKENNGVGSVGSGTTPSTGIGTPQGTSETQTNTPASTGIDNASLTSIAASLTSICEYLSSTKLMN